MIATFIGSGNEAEFVSAGVVISILAAIRNFAQRLETS
jgi:hypothetical protein